MLLNESPLYIYMNIYIYIYLSYFFYPFIYQCTFGCFQILAIVNNAAMSMRVEMTLQIPDFIFLNIYTKAGLHNTMVLFLIA